MIQWKRVKTAAGWGLFYGIITWLLFTTIDNTIRASGVRAIIFSRILLGLIIGIVQLRFPWWVRGILLGISVDLFFTLLFYLPLGRAVDLFCSGWDNNIWFMFITGVIIGVLIELSLKHRRSKSE